MIIQLERYTDTVHLAFESPVASTKKYFQKQVHGMIYLKSVSTKPFNFLFEVTMLRQFGDVDFDFGCVPADSNTACDVKYIPPSRR